MQQVNIGNITVGSGQPLTIIAGPCVIENETMIFKTVETILNTLSGQPLQFIFKASYKKANRTSIRSFQGMDSEAAFRILANIKQTFGCPILTDIHSAPEALVAGDIADVLQIPAFLCRQTELLLAAGRTGRAVNVKKGQFLAPGDMQNVVDKIVSTGNEHILLTERGSSFGYHNLVVDMRGLVIMADTGYPVVYDATHSVQLPAGNGEASGGEPEFILPLARAAVATGAVCAVFMEVHPDPRNALSDSASQLALSEFPKVVEQLVRIYENVLNPA